MTVLSKAEENVVYSDEILNTPCLLYLHISYRPLQLKDTGSLES